MPAKAHCSSVVVTAGPLHTTRAASRLNKRVIQLSDINDCSANRHNSDLKSICSVDNLELLVTLLPNGAVRHGWPCRHFPAAPGVHRYVVQMVLRSTYLSIACGERSRPNPDCLKPPN